MGTFNSHVINPHQSVICGGSHAIQNVGFDQTADWRQDPSAGCIELVEVEPGMFVTREEAQLRTPTQNAFLKHQGAP